MSKIVKVANPIYDVVFKYLLEDQRVAKLLISALLELQVVDLELKPQEYSQGIKTKESFVVYRVDFKARIKDSEGNDQIVLIELQKAKLPSDIMRFRRYLGMQYAHKDNVVEINDEKKALPIITIYFLGYPLDDFEKTPIIRVSRKYIDHATKRELTGKNYFIESLSHDSIIVQIKALKNKARKNKLEKVLSVFEQGTIHEVDINEEDYPKEYREIIRRLIKALASPEVRETMNVEDDILQEIANRERLLAKLQEENKYVREEAAQERKDKEEAKFQAAQERKDKEEAKLQAAQERKEKEETKLKLAKMMKEFGKTVEEIREQTGLSSSEIDNL